MFTLPAHGPARHTFLVPYFSCQANLLANLNSSITQDDDVSSLEDEFPLTPANQAPNAPSRDVFSIGNTEGKITLQLHILFAEPLWT